MFREFRVLYLKIRRHERRAARRDPGSFQKNKQNGQNYNPKQYDATLIGIAIATL